MLANDLCTDIATLLSPFPTSGEAESENNGAVAADHILHEREELAESLQNSWSYGDIDPLLSTLTRLQEQRLKLEFQMRILIAYAREFTHPRPYKLIDLANAVGMSISGVRTAYEAAEIAHVSEILGRPPVGERMATSDAAEGT
jgi:hypothetical protein